MTRRRLTLVVLANTALTLAVFRLTPAELTSTTPTMAGNPSDALLYMWATSHVSRSLLGDLGQLFQGGIFHPGGLRIRVSSLPSRIGEAAERLAQDGGAVLAYPAQGLLYVRFPVGIDSDGHAVEVAVRSAREAALAGGGGFELEDAPDWAKQGRDVFGDPGPLLPLFRALKHQYDPEGVLNPGRFAGRL